MKKSHATEKLADALAYKQKLQQKQFETEQKLATTEIEIGKLKAILQDA